MDLTCSADSCSSALTPFGIDGSESSSAALKLSTFFLLLGFQGESADAIITNVSVIQSWRWFFHLSPFESVFLGLIIGEIGALSLLGIIPVNLHDLWNQQGEYGRKKRQVAPQVTLATKEMAYKMLNLYKRLDQNECGFRALCELQSKVTCGDYDKRRLPHATQLVLTSLLSYAKRSLHSTVEGNGETGDKRRAALQPYAEAVEIGSRNIPNYKNSSITTESECESRYFNCPATTEEIIDYVEHISFLDY